MINEQLKNYTYLGCFKDPSSNILAIQPNNGTGDDNRYYSIEDCQKEALQNNSVLYGLQKNNEDDNLGKCFLSNQLLNPLEQVNSVVVNGLSDTEKCNNDNSDINLDLVYINNLALNFFNDIDLNKYISDDIQKYKDKLSILNINFAHTFSEFKNNVYKNIDESEYTDLKDNLDNSNYNNVKQIINEYNNLTLEIKSENEKLESYINKINTILNTNDKLKFNSDNKLNLLLDSDNGTIGDYNNTKKYNNFLIAENILFIIIIIIFSIIIFKNK